jgi:hypothetical protein
MKRTAFALLFAANLMYGSDVSWNLSGSNGQIDGFSLSIGDYYRVPVNDVVILERSIPRDEMSVVYYLARHSHKSPHYISDLRLRGMSWWDITLRLGLNPRTIYVVSTHERFGPPYGLGYGHGPSHHHLRDADIVDLVNVRFLSDYHHVSPDDVIRYRRGGEHYHNIDDRYRGNHHEIGENRRDLREDRSEIRDDRHEIRGDKREIRDDRREMGGDRREIREDKRELRDDRRELHDDRRDLRDDRRDNRDDRRDDHGR